MFRWEGGAAFMILELGFILTDYVRQLSFLCIPHFPGNGSYTWPGTFDRSPLGTQCPTLVCTLRKLQEGRRITGPFYWACAQGRYGTGPRACMGLGSRCRTIGTGPRACMGLGSWCRTERVYHWVTSISLLRYNKITKCKYLLYYGEFN